MRRIILFIVCLCGVIAFSNSQTLTAPYVGSYAVAETTAVLGFWGNAEISADKTNGSMEFDVTTINVGAGYGGVVTKVGMQTLWTAPVAGNYNVSYHFTTKGSSGGWGWQVLGVNFFLQLNRLSGSVQGNGITVKNSKTVFEKGPSLIRLLTESASRMILAQFGGDYVTLALKIKSLINLILSTDSYDMTTVVTVPKVRIEKDKQYVLEGAAEVNAGSGLISVGGFVATRDSFHIRLDKIVIENSVGAPQLYVSQDEVDFGVVRKGTSVSRILYLANLAGGNMQWNANASQSWISLSPTSGAISGSDVAQLSVTANTTGLGYGVQNANITITAENNIATVSISVDVSDGTGNFTVDADRHDLDANICISHTPAVGQYTFKKYYTNSMPLNFSVAQGDKVELRGFSDSEKWRVIGYNLLLNGTPQRTNGNWITINIIGTNATIQAVADYDRRYVVSGRVIDTISGSGIQGVTVYVDGSGVNTNKRGEFYLGYRSTDDYSVTLGEKLGYQFSPSRLGITLPPDATELYFYGRETTPPSAPDVFSKTHSSQDRWFSNTNPSFEWTSPRDSSGIVKYCYTFNASSDYNPSPVSDSVTTGTSIEIRDATEGVRYFHLRAMDGAQNWGESAHYRIAIDTGRPDTVRNLRSFMHSPGRVRVEWEAATDNLSGIEYYLILWDHSPNTVPSYSLDSMAFAIPSDSLGVTSPLLSGTNNWYFHIRAIDAAYNVSDIVAHIGPLIHEPSSTETTKLMFPARFSLCQNFPNPFNPTTKFEYALPVQSFVRLEIFNIFGQQLAVLVHGELDAGYHQAVWNANVASGVYFYRIEAIGLGDTRNKFVDVKKMILLR